jgi:hypothetical protein
MKTKHPYADILIAIAAGENVQFRGSEDQPFRDQGDDVTLEEISCEEFPPSCYRVAPDAIQFNGISIPRPLKEHPTSQTTYYYADYHSDEGYYSDTWDCHDLDLRRFASGMTWAKEEDVVEAVAALKQVMAS